MDAYIMAVEAGDEEFNLERKGTGAKKEKEKENTKEVTRPNLNFLQQQLQIHDDKKVSTFWDGKPDDEMIGSGSPRK